MSVSGIHVEGNRRTKRNTREPFRARRQKKLDMKAGDSLESDDSYTEVEDEAPVRMMSKF